MNRTQEEIAKRIEEVKDNDFFGTTRQDIVCFLDFENAKEYINSETPKDAWDKVRKACNDPKFLMKEYMEFAWGKANNCRGLSAARSLDHYKAWLWLDGNDELCKELDEYEFYGKDHLVKICEYLGLDHSQWDDGVRRNE